MTAKATIIASKFLIAVLILFSFDGLLRLTFHSNPYESLKHTLIWWRVNEFSQQCASLNRPPNIVLFGSSLMLVAVTHGDANFLKKPVDTVTHSRDFCLESELASKSNCRPATFSFAVGGQMASDVYAISNTILTKKNNPDLVIWGIAPRDFVDNSFPGPFSSPTASYMSRLAGKDVVGDEGKSEKRSSFWGTANSILHAMLALYEKRLDVLLAIHNDTDRILENVRSAVKAARLEGNGHSLLSKNMTSDGERKFVVNFTDDSRPGDEIINPENERPKAVVDNSAQYRLCYNPFNSYKFETQLSYLNKFLADRKTLGTRVLLVNMPLTKANMSLMPAGVYERYLKSVKGLAQKYGVEETDFNTNNLFCDSDFFDEVHLNGFGGKKFSVLLASYIQQSGSLLSQIHRTQTPSSKSSEVSRAKLSLRGSAI